MIAKKGGKILSGGHKGSRAGRVSNNNVGYRDAHVKLMVRWGIKRKITSYPKRLKPPPEGTASVLHPRLLAEL